MQNNMDNQMNRIREHKIGSLELPDNHIHPYYDGFAISNLPDSIATWLGVPRIDGHTLNDDLHNQLADDTEHIILLVMDGLGLNWLRDFLEHDPIELPGIASWQRLMQDGQLFALTSVVPSTTSAALTSLWTGKTPLEHGIVGFEMWLKEYGMIANMIHHSPASYNHDNGSLIKTGFDPQTFLPVPLIGKHLSGKGIKSFAFQPSSITHSGLSQMLLQGVKMFPYRTQSDLWVSLQQHVEKRQHLKTYTYIYCSELDTLAHMHGPQDERLHLEFSNTSMMIERFVSKQRKTSNGRTLFLMVADHGQIKTPKVDHYHLTQHPELKDMLVMQPSGENRFSYLFERNGSLSDIESYIKRTWSDKFTLHLAEEIISSGLLGNGKPHPAIKDRLGDLVLIPNENNYLWWAEKENPLLGRHGGLSADEMLVPIFAMMI